MIEFWLKSDTDGIEFLLPVTPSKYDISYSNAIETLNSIVGDINIMTSYKLSIVKLEGFFTVNRYPFANRKTYEIAKNSMDYVELIKMFVAYKRIVRLIIAGDNITRVNLPFFVEEINYSEKDASGDIYYTITLKEYRPVSISRDGKPKQETKKSNGNEKKTHTVVASDTLRKLARSNYGDGDLWTKIYEANKDKIKNPELIYDGQELIIP